MEAIRRASWGARFWAWLIDLLLMSILGYLISIVLNIAFLGRDGIAIQAGLMFLYWTALEGYRGQSIGKMILNLEVVGPVGDRIGFRDAGIESFGKAFLLPLDCLAGWLLLRGSGQRLFNMLSNTVVVYAEDVTACPR
ncbi:MAG: RDD family protein [Methanosaeta sp. PtaU1.Bin060]|jgi:uncharacterized RDD family membrane protein YckC|nr:MAG: RDD family protein [Methanosaeta sp. PtaU1.Bin060]